MTLIDGARRVLLTHAHPDDESLATGALIVELVARGAQVQVLTATRGEQGEVVSGVLPPDTDEDALSEHRMRELDAGGHVLGVHGHSWLGTPPARRVGAQPRRYRDSGMRWVTPTVAGPADTTDEGSFVAADPEDEIADLMAFLQHWQPDLIITYDADGGYGHPDHVRMHEVTREACARMRVRALEVLPPGRESEAPTGVEWHSWPQHEGLVAQALRAYRSQLTVHELRPAADGASAGYEIEHVGGQREPIVTRLGLRRL